MAYYEHLPIYKKSMILAVYIENMVRGFSRYHKYSLGSDLRRLAHKIICLIIRANSQVQRLPTLLILREVLESLKVSVRLCKEVRAFNSLNSFVHTIEQVIVLSRQNEGWIKSIQHKVKNMPAGGGLISE
jgi:hypothetical protein